jgi:hypothetical protein
MATPTEAAWLSIVQRAEPDRGSPWITNHYHDLYYAAADGEANVLTVKHQNLSVLFTDLGAPIKLTAPGLLASSDPWTCTATTSKTYGLAACIDRGIDDPVSSVTTSLGCELQPGSCQGGPHSYIPGFAWVTIVTGDGDDAIYAADGQPEGIYCGPGNDTVVANNTDYIAPSCETTIRP